MSHKIKVSQTKLKDPHLNKLNKLKNLTQKVQLKTKQKVFFDTILKIKLKVTKALGSSLKGGLND